MVKKRKQRRKLSAEYKAEIVKLVVSGGQSVPSVCSKHGLHESSVYAWVKQGWTVAMGPQGRLRQPRRLI